MSQDKFPYQPTLRHVFNSEALSEAQVIFGQDLLDRPVVQVVTSLTPLPRAGSLLVTGAGSFGSQEAESVKTLSGLAVIKSYPVLPSGAVLPEAPLSAGTQESLKTDVELSRLAGLCANWEIPLIVIPGFGEASQSADDVRQAFLTELKRNSSRMHAHLISLVIAEGLSGLIEELFTWINRPLAVETADFKILAAKNMGAIPPTQQRMLTEGRTAEVNRQLRGHCALPDFALSPVKIGRRLVFPVVLDDVVVGYLSVMVKANDDTDLFAEYLAPAALACMVDFSRRRKEISTLSATHQSLLKDLLSGRGLSATDQERLERHYGFDLCDGLFVFAVHLVSSQKEPVKDFLPGDGRYVSTDIEGTRVLVVPYDRKSGRTWQQESEHLAGLIKKASPDLKVQLGAGRLTASTLDLGDSYREARQALIIGSMIYGEKEFSISYGDLGVKRLLYLMFDHPELDRFYEENLAPLEAYDAEWESELVPTLFVYLKHGANLNSAARALFIHRHTLRYRLEQIADILKVDIDSQEVLLNLQIAFMIKDMKGKSVV